MTARAVKGSQPVSTASLAWLPRIRSSSTRNGPRTNQPQAGWLSPARPQLKNPHLRNEPLRPPVHHSSPPSNSTRRPLSTRIPARLQSPPPSQTDRPSRSACPRQIRQPEGQQPARRVNSRGGRSRGLFQLHPPLSSPTPENVTTCRSYSAPQPIFI